MIELFANWHDIQDAPDATLAKLELCGATRVLPMIQAAIASDGGLKRYRQMVHSFADRCIERGIEVTLCTGPGVLRSPDQLGCRDRLEYLCGKDFTPMLDAEPTDVDTPLERHWTSAEVQRWLQLPNLAITSTRAEIDNVGEIDCDLYLQLESEASTATLPQALRIATRFCPVDRITLTFGTFDKKGRPKRSVQQIITDLDRGKEQILRVGRFAEWVAQTTSDDECRALREWAEKVRS